jgi:hypothetical protein
VGHVPQHAPNQDAEQQPSREDEPMSIILKVSSMGILGPDDSNTCPISMEVFDKARVEFLPEDTCLFEGRPELCVGMLPCGHMFHSISIIFHMALSGMRCPVCRCVFFQYLVTCYYTAF